MSELQERVFHSENDKRRFTLSFSPDRLFFTISWLNNRGVNASHFNILRDEAISVAEDILDRYKLAESAPAPREENELDTLLDAIEGNRYADGNDWADVIKARRELAFIRSQLVSEQERTHDYQENAEWYKARAKAAEAEVKALREAWYSHYCELWGERRKEQQEHMSADIDRARAAIEGSAKEEGKVEALRQALQDLKE